MDGADWALILGSVGAVTGIAGLAISYRGLGIANRSAKASEASAAAAKATVDFQIEAYRKEKSANLRFVPMNTAGHTIVTRIEQDILWMAMHLSNSGPHWANDIRLTATIYDLAVASENPPVSVAPNSKEEVSVPVNLIAIPRSIRTKFDLKLSYTDGNGTHDAEFPVRMEGLQDENIIHAWFISPERP